jgi:hypothetical protein
MISDEVFVQITVLNLSLCSIKHHTIEKYGGMEA